MLFIRTTWYLLTGTGRVALEREGVTISFAALGYRYASRRGRRYLRRLTATCANICFLLRSLQTNKQLSRIAAKNTNTNYVVFANRIFVCSSHEPCVFFFLQNVTNRVFLFFFLIAMNRVFFFNEYLLPFRTVICFFAFLVNFVFQGRSDFCVLPHRNILFYFSPGR